MSTALHEWVGTDWTPAYSIDSWDYAIQKFWPGAKLRVVARGAVWTISDQIVAELRNCGGRYPREAWIARPQSPAGDHVNPSSSTLTAKD